MGELLRITLAACTGPREVCEWALDLPAGSVVRDALQAAGLEIPWEPASVREVGWTG